MTMPLAGWIALVVLLTPFSNFISIAETLSLMKRFSLTLCLAFTSAGLAFADHHEGDQDLNKKLDALLDGISQPDEAARYEPRMALRDLTSAASTPGSKSRDATIKLLLDRLGKSETSNAAKAWILRQLENIGRAESVPALTKMMGSPFHHLRESARRALEQNLSSEASAAMRSLAEKEKDRGLKRALIHSLGQRRDAEAVGLIKSQLESKDKDLHRIAIASLGKIASDDSIKALTDLAQQGSMKHLAADALLEATRRLSPHHPDKAMPILEALYQDNQPAKLQAAALRGLLAASPKGGDDLILIALQSKEAAVRQAAINGCRSLKGPSVLPNVLAVKLPDLPVNEQAMTLEVLGASKDVTVASQLANMVGDEKLNSEIRQHMIRVLGQLGGVDAATRMLSLANDADAQEAARAALASMPGAGVDALLVSATQSGDLLKRTEAIRALGSRGDAKAVPVLFVHVDKGPKAIREASFSALGELVSSEDMIRLVSYAKGDDKSAVKAVVQACRRATAPDKAADAIIAAMGSLDAAGKEQLLPCLGILGGEKALSKTQELLKDKALAKAAMKTLTTWSGTEAGPALLKLAGADGISNEDRTLTLRGLSRLLENPKNGIKPEDRLKQALGGLEMAKRVEDKRLFVPIIGKLGTRESVTALTNLLKDKEIAEEAAHAALTSAKKMRGRRGGRTKQEILKAIIRSDVDKDTIKEAQKMLGEMR
ncbi:MAG: HEAT repeat protein [Verrucomicrobiales bacterium]|jgi:HEAT repeat protein